MDELDIISLQVGKQVYQIVTNRIKETISVLDESGEFIVCIDSGGNEVYVARTVAVSVTAKPLPFYGSPDLKYKVEKGYSFVHTNS